MIEYLLHDQIDKQEWDRLNDRPGLGSFYNCSAVLDIASPDWHALIDRDTGHSMPLTWRKKMGFQYLFQPIGLQKMCVCGSDANAHLKRFLGAVPAHFKLWDLSVEQFDDLSGVEASKAVNCTLPLGTSYTELSAAFSSNHKRNLRSEIPTMEGLDVQRFMEYFSQTTAKRFKINARDLNSIGKLLNHADTHGGLDIRAVDGTQCAAAFIRWKNQLIFFKSSNDDAGKEVKGLFHLVNELIRENAGSDVVLDFAGSDNPGTQRFYTGFGAETHVYLRLKRNALPFPFRSFK